MGFDLEWLAARRRYDEAALDPSAIRAIQTWAAALPPDCAPIVVDLGSGTGTALTRVTRWLAPRLIAGYAVDHDAALLAQADALTFHTLPNGHTGAEEHPVRLLGDLLEPISGLGGPPDGTVDLVLGHALADLLPLERLAARAMALVRPGGLVHLALAYDGLTTFESMGETGLTHEPGPGPVTCETVVLDLFHRHMDRRRQHDPTYGGSTAGRRLAAALVAAGLEIVTDAPSIWQVAADDGPDGERVLAWLLRFVAEAARDMNDKIGAVPPVDLARWEDARLSALAAGTLSARVGHRDVLARRPG